MSAFLPTRCVCESNLGGELITRLSAYPKMTAALTSLPPKMLRLAAGASPQEIKPDVSNLAGRVSAVKSRLGKATFTSTSDARMVPRLYEDYVKNIVGALLPTLALAGAEAPKLDLPTLPSVKAPDPPLLRLADGQLLLQGCQLQLGEVRGGRLWLHFSDVDAEVDLDSCSQVVLPWRPPVMLPWRPPTEGWATTFFEKMAELKKNVDALKTEVDGLDNSVQEAAEVQKIEEKIAQKIEVLVPEFGGEVTDKVKKMIGLGALRQSVKELQVQDMKKCAAETSRRVVEAQKHDQPLCMRRYRSGQWLTVRQPGGQWLDFEVGSDDAPLRLAGQETLQLHPWNHAPRELLQNDFEVLRKWWMRKLTVQHSDITDALTGKRLDVLQQCVAINMDGADRWGIQDASSLSQWLHSCHAKCCKGSKIDAPAAALLTGPPAAGKTSLMSQVRAARTVSLLFYLLIMTSMF